MASLLRGDKGVKAFYDKSNDKLLLNKNNIVSLLETPFAAGT